MSPRTLLLLWRERWAKVSDTPAPIPYNRGGLKKWSDQFARTSMWSTPLVPQIVTALCLLILLVSVTVEFTMHSQVVVSAALIVLALLLRQFAGTLVSLILAVLAVATTLRYLVWRFTDTLSTGADLHFLFGFILVCAETYFVLLLAIRFARAVWPMTREPGSRHAEHAGPLANAPAIDLCIVCNGQPATQVSLAARRALALAWPSKKLKVHLLDDAHRDDVATLAASLGAHYVVSAVASSGQEAQLISATATMKGELTAVLDCDYQPQTDFLSIVWSWFRRDARLAILQTPHHFLAPAPLPIALKASGSSAAGDKAPACAILRHAALTQEATGKPLAQALRDQGMGTAYLGHRSTVDNGPGGQEPVPGVGTSRLFLLEHPYSRTALRIKQRLADFESALQFYFAIPRFLFLTAPALAILGGMQIILTTPELMAAYGLPHLVHGSIAMNRLRREGRMSLLKELRELLVGCKLFALTTLNVIRAHISYALRSISGNAPGLPLPFGPLMTLGFIALFGINAAAMTATLMQGLANGFAQHGMDSLFLGWSLFNIAMLGASLAVTREAQQIEAHTRRQAQLPAMMKLPFGRTVSCSTTNFPEVELALSVPDAAFPESGRITTLILFYGEREFIFSGHVLKRANAGIRVQLDAQSITAYSQLANAVMTRGRDWPTWLPGRDADRLIPLWLSSSIVAVLVAVLDFVMHFGDHLRRANPANLFRLLKRRHEKN